MNKKCVLKKNAADTITSLHLSKKQKNIVYRALSGLEDYYIKDYS